MNDQIVLSANEIFQLAAIGPCLAIIAYLLYATRKPKQVIIPIAFFACLLGTFLLPILSIFPELNQDITRNVLFFIEHLLPIFAFLLIAQFLYQGPPPWQYWLILTVPLIGGSGFFYLVITRQEACFASGDCINAKDMMEIYRTVTTSVIFLLLIPLINKKLHTHKKRRSHEWKQQYWLIIILMLYSLLTLLIDLVVLSELIDTANANFIQTMISVSFIYLVMSSIFRVFHKSFAITPLGNGLTTRDKELLAQIQTIIDTQHPYRDLQFNRGMLADMLGLTEQHLSKLINTHYKKSFSELMNYHRISEAKALLTQSDKSITEISFDVGFRSITSFNRVFKDHTQLAPSKYRAREKRLSGE